MIILQILAGILLIALSLVMLLIFNIHVRHWVWNLLLLSYGLFYAMTAAVLCMERMVAVWVMGILALFYLLRMHRMAIRLSEKESGKTYPIVKGDIISREPKFRMAFVFPLSFLKISKLTPGAINRKMSRETGLEIELEKLIPRLLREGKGTEVKITSEKADLYFEIQ